MIEASELRSLRKCVLTLRADPAAVHRPELRFVREWLRSLGAALPPAPAAVVTESESSSGSELDADLRPRASARDAALPPPPRGDPTQPTDAAARERAAELKARGVELLAGGDSDAALHVLSDAVLLDPRSSMALGARALCLVALGRPTHALADADAALAINAHYAKAHRARGEALVLLCRWEEAQRALQAAASMDFDEAVHAALADVAPRVERIAVRRAAVRRRRAAREGRREARMAQRLKAEAASRRAAAKATYEADKAVAASERAARGDGVEGDEEAPGAHIGARQRPHAAESLPGMDAEGIRGLAHVDLSSMWGDPDVQAALRDPELTPIVTDVLRNPASAAKYTHNPRMAHIIRKCLLKVGHKEDAGDWYAHW